MKWALRPLECLSDGLAKSNYWGWCHAVVFLQSFIDTITVRGSPCNGQIQSRESCAFKTTPLTNRANRARDVSVHWFSVWFGLVYKRWWELVSCRQTMQVYNLWRYKLFDLNVNYLDILLGLFVYYRGDGVIVMSWNDARQEHDVLSSISKEDNIY